MKEEKENGGLSGGSEGASTGSNRGSERGSKGDSGNKSIESGRDNKKVGSLREQTSRTSDSDSGQAGRDFGQHNTDNRGNSGGSGRSSDGSNGRDSGNNNNRDTRTASDSDGEKIVSEKPSIVKKPKDVKPSKSTAKTKDSSKKDSGDITDPETLSVILQSSFALIAGITNRKHWNIDEEEALTIAQPASTMIQKLTTAQKKKINSYTAPIVLGSAIASIVVPRLVLDLAMKGGNKNNVRNKSEISTVQQSINNQNNIESRNNEQQTNTQNVKAATTANDREIAGLFRNLDFGARPADIKI